MTQSNDFTQIRYDYQNQEVQALFDMPLMQLLDIARHVHKTYHPEGEVQLASLLSIKTGYCAENCGYCPQSAHWAKKTGMPKSSIMSVETVREKAQKAKEAGASRFCMGAAWKDVKDGEEFDTVLEMVGAVKDLGMEACVTLGRLSQDQAQRLADAGVTAYNHNIDTSPEFYDKIITTRSFDDRIQTLDHVRKAGMSVCCGGIIGMGEGIHDRAVMLRILSNMNPHPESVPINALVAVKGTPLEDQKPVNALEFIRTIAVARIIMPKARVRLSAGRKDFSDEMQVMAFYAGANSIFYGEKLLTTDNNDAEADLRLIEQAGLKIQKTPSYA
jgi:biotin synthase